MNSEREIKQAIEKTLDQLREGIHCIVTKNPEYLFSDIDKQAQVALVSANEYQKKSKEFIEYVDSVGGEYSPEFAEKLMDVFTWGMAVNIRYFMTLVHINLKADIHSRDEISLDNFWEEVK